MGLLQLRRCWYHLWHHRSRLRLEGIWDTIAVAIYSNVVEVCVAVSVCINAGNS
jgi:hypothetical protein